MITKLDNKYLVLTWDDIGKYLNNSEKRALAMAIDKVEMGRARDKKSINKAYTVVSETMNEYSMITQMVLDDINGVEHISTEDEILLAVEDALAIERKKVYESNKLATTNKKGAPNVKDKS